MAFRIGQQVVCVDDTFSRRWVDEPGTPNLPKKGAVYHVRATFNWEFLNGYNPALLLVELVNPQYGWRLPFGRVICEHPFAARRFRPLIEKSANTGMAILRKVADDAARTKELVRD